MTQNVFDEIKRKAKFSKAFQYMEGETWKVCNDLSIMPYKRGNLGNYIDELENKYNAEINALKKQNAKQQEIIDMLFASVKELNK